MGKRVKKSPGADDAGARALLALRDRGFRITRARRKLITLLAQPHSSHTVAETVSALRGVDQVTVYRMLDLLEAEGIVTTIRVPSAPVRYELPHAHHHHIVCLDCGTLAHVPCDEHRYTTTRTSFAEVLGHDVLLYGRCRSCA